MDALRRSPSGRAFDARLYRENWTSVGDRNALQVWSGGPPTITPALDVLTVVVMSRRGWMARLAWRETSQ